MNLPLVDLMARLPRWLAGTLTRGAAARAADNPYAPAMGFMDKLKAAKNSLTGDWADVSIDVEPAARGESLTVTATVTVKGEQISNEGIVVEIVCQEEIDIPEATVHEPGTLTQSCPASRRAPTSAAGFETEVQTERKCDEE